MEELNDVITKLDQLDSFMYVLEGAYLDACTGGGEESARFCNLLYLLWDQISTVKNNLLIIRETHK